MPNLTDEEQIERVKNRVDGWFKNREQNNSKILITFLQLISHNEQETVTYEDLKNQTDLDDSIFKSNFDQMKNNGDKNTGKVFEEIGSNIKLWKPVEEIIINKFLEIFPKNINEAEKLKIYEKLVETFKNEENNIFKRNEIIQKVLQKYPNTNQTSIIPSDYCINKKNKGSSKYELFEYMGNAEYKVLKIRENKMNTKNIILYGVPGVGKTHNINKLINLIEKNENSENEIFQKISQNSETNEVLDDENLESRVVFTTFHQSFAYEDFIEGFRPNELGQILLRDGIFKIICDKARDDKEKNYYLVIDEINRGNISKIFGELITLIEESKRDKLEISLPYSQEKFTVPSNLFIIGTMNSTDKSIALIDIALRRRFTFLELKPNETLIKNPNIRDFFIKLNKQLEDDYKIGHSYFMGENIDLEFVKEYKIKPLLKEYFYGNSEKLNEVLKIIEVGE